MINCFIKFKFKFKYNFITIILLFAIYLTFFPNLAFSQVQLHVDIEDSIYTILDICSIKGAIQKLSYVKPYSKSKIIELINECIRNSNRLSNFERRYLLKTLINYKTKEFERRKIKISENSEFRMLIVNSPVIHSFNMLKIQFIGDLHKNISYDFNIGFLFDKIDPNAFVPYDFTKRWDGFHLWFDKRQFSDGINNHFNLAWNTYPELAYISTNKKIKLELARYRHEWGNGIGSLNLSSTARPINAFEGYFWLSSNLKLSFLTGILGNWAKEKAEYTEQKMFSTHQIEYFPFDWLYITFGENVVWPNRLDLLYLNPFMFYYLGQNIIGDIDNLSYHGSFMLTFSPYVRFYFNYFIDELENESLNVFFQYPQNQYAWQTGIKLPIPFLPFSLFTLQYTKIEPYCYTHYPQEVSDFTKPVNINYTNDGENIGYHLPPNSDEFLLKIFSCINYELSAEIQYQLIRHGSGNHEDGQIEGDINIWLDYGNMDKYPAKNFLHDGVYEYINALKLKLYYNFPLSETKIWIEYNYFKARNYKNVLGNYKSNNIIGIGCQLIIK